MSQAGQWRYYYDANGNMKTVKLGETLQKTIEWTADNKPASINNVKFTYDHAGRRVKKEASLTTYYIDPVLEYVNSGTFIAYIFANGKRMAKKIGSSVSYYHTDHLGSTASATNESGIRTYEAHYTPYGETWYVSSTTEKYKFTGQEEDAETGFYNYGARHYDPALARFVSADSIVPDYTNPQSLNRYAYCLNNPINRVDPDGHAAPWFHYNVTYEAAIRYGCSPSESRRQAFQAMMIDFNGSSSKTSSDYTSMHGMAGFDPAFGDWQTAAEAIHTTISTIVYASASGNLALADHATLDLVTHRGESMKLYDESFGYRIEHWKRDGNVLSDIQKWATDKMLINREIRDYYQQFDRSCAYIPGPIASYRERYDLGAFTVEDWSGSAGYFSSPSNATISMPNFSVMSMDWSTLHEQWPYPPVN